MNDYAEERSKISKLTQTNLHDLGLAMKNGLYRLLRKASMASSGSVAVL